MSLGNKIFSRLGSLDVIISPPSVIREILPLLDEAEFSAEKLSNVILKDPSLTARVLKVANSSFYGYSGQVNNVNQAVMILGQDMVKCLIMSISIHNQVTSREPGKDAEYTQLWKHFLETASVAKNIAMTVNHGMEEEAYIAGLLHDFGRLFLLKFFSAELFQVNRLVREGQSLIAAERKILGTDHQEIGDFVARKWSLPESLMQTMSNHHPKPGEKVNDLPLLSKIVILADNLSPAGQELPDSPDGAAARIELIDSCVVALGLDLTGLDKFHSTVPKEVLGNAEGMEIDLGDAVEYLSKINADILKLYLDLANIFRDRQEVSGRMLTEERLEGMLESLQIALATLSHYINNASMNISGQCDVLQMLYDRGETEKVSEKIPEMTRSIKSSVRKISLVLEELSKLSSLRNINYIKDSRAIDIEESLRHRLETKLNSC
jgi:HD-like signal output (HDOD) protein